MGKTYLFHVAIPRSGRTWRKIEMRGNHTLEDLHHVIQDAFEFDDDHLYSFFMSGKAWDSRTEYTLPEGVSPYGSLFANSEADVMEAEENDRDDFLRQQLEPLGLSADQVADVFPSVQAEMTGEINSEAPSDVIQKLGKLSGRDPSLIAQYLIYLQQQWDEIMRDEQRDVRKVTIESLELTVGKKFLYLFDYGDEWRFNVRLDAIHETDQPDAFPKIVQVVGKPPPQYPELSEEDDDWGEEDDDGGFVIYDDDDER